MKGVTFVNLYTERKSRFESTNHFAAEQGRLILQTERVDTRIDAACADNLPLAATIYQPMRTPKWSTFELAT
jgi:hypothetical protein